MVTLTSLEPGTRVHDKFHQWTCKVVRALGAGYLVQRIGNPPTHTHTPGIELYTEYLVDPCWLQPIPK